jgi:hydroxypyruvate reductase
LLSELYRCAVDSVDGARVLAKHAMACEGEWRFEREGRTLNLPLPVPHSGGRLRLIGIGKAAAALAEGVIASLSERHRPDDVFLIVNEASRAQATRLMGTVSPGALTIHVGEHPLPGAASEAAGRALIEFIGTPRVEDRYIVMLSGGASEIATVTNRAAHQPSAPCPPRGSRWLTSSAPPS